MNKVVAAFLAMSLFPVSAFAQKARICVPIHHQQPSETQGLRSLGSNVDYESLCSKPGFSCKDSPATGLDPDNSKCFFITNRNGKIPMSIEPKSELGSHRNQNDDGMPHP